MDIEKLFYEENTVLMFDGEYGYLVMGGGRDLLSLRRLKMTLDQFLSHVKKDFVVYCYQEFNNYNRFQGPDLNSIDVREFNKRVYDSVQWHSLIALFPRYYNKQWSW